MKEPHGGIPGHSRALAGISPFGRRRQQSPDGTAKRPGEMGNGIVDCDNEIQRRDDCGELVKVFACSARLIDLNAADARYLVDLAGDVAVLK